MRNVYTTINDYYNIFDSYKGVFSPKSWITWFMGISMFLFCASIFWLVGVLKLESYFGYSVISYGDRKAIIICLALTTLFSWIKVSLRKSEVVRQRAQHVIGTNEIKLWKLEKLWLEKFLPYKQSEYLSLAEQIDKSVYLREKNKGFSNFSGRSFLEHIFSSESKPRVLAMLLMLFASVLTLSVRAGADINTVFQFYSSASWREFSMFHLFFPIICYVAFIEIKLAIVICAIGIERVIERGNSQSVFSRRKTKIFINVLVRFFAFEKPKVRVMSES